MIMVLTAYQAQSPVRTRLKVTNHVELGVLGVGRVCSAIHWRNYFGHRPRNKTNHQTC